MSASPVPLSSEAVATPRRQRKTTTMDAAKLSRKRATDRRSQQAFRERTRLKIEALEDRLAEMSQNVKELSRQLDEVTAQRDRLSKDWLELKDQASLNSVLQAKVQALTDERDRLRPIQLRLESELSGRRQSLQTSILQDFRMSPRPSIKDPNEIICMRARPRTSIQKTILDGESPPTTIRPDIVSSSEPAIQTPITFQVSAFAGGVSLNDEELPPPPLQSNNLATVVDFETMSFRVSHDQSSPQYGATESLQHVGDDPLHDTLSDHFSTDDLATDYSTDGLIGDNSVTSARNLLPPHSPDVGRTQLQPAPSPSQRGPRWSPTSSSHVEPCEQLPYNLSPVIPSDRILQALIASRRCEAAKGVPWDELLGPELPCWAWLVNPTANVCVHAICRAVIDIVRAYTGYSSFPEKVASVYTMYTSTRWRLWPQIESFRKTPSWMHPRPIQLRVAHPAWMDRVPWPTMREMLVSNQELYRVEDFGAFHSTSVSLNWPYAPDNVLIGPSGKPAKDGDTVVVLNPAFEEHMRNMRNWTLGSRFTQRYPELADAIRQDVEGGYWGD